MSPCALIRALVVVVVVAASPGLALAGHPAPPAIMDPKNLTAEQNELLNYAYLVLRPDLLRAINPTGDQVVAVRHARVGIIYVLSLQRTREDEALIRAGRPTSPGMVRFVLEHLAPVRDVLSDAQRAAFAKLMTDQKLEPVTVDASTGHFLLLYTFGPNDRVEKAKAPDGRILDVVVPEKEDIKQWKDELKTGDDLLRALQNKHWQVGVAAIDWLIEHGSGTLDAPTKKRIAEAILTRAEQDDIGANPGRWMQAYSQVGQAEHEQRVRALVDKTIVHHTAGVVAAYASVAPAKALDYIAKATPDPHFRIRAIEGLGMTPDALRLLQSARTKMPDMAWKIDNQIKQIQERDKARAQGKPENPGLAELEARRAAQRQAAEQARVGKKPGDYQGYDDWFADLSGTDRRNVDKASTHFVTSVHAVDLATVTPQQRAAVFALALPALTAPRPAMLVEHAGQLLVAAAGPDDTQTLLEMIAPDKRRVHYPLAALMRVNPDKAQQVLLDMEHQRFRPNPIADAVKLVPAQAIPVLEAAQPKLQTNGVREYYGQLIADLKKRAQ